MARPSLKNLPLQDLAGLICAHLEDRGIRAVLVGGAVISIYTQNRYQSFDLDFVTGADGKQLAEAMKELGFRPKVRGAKDLYHPETDYYVEFVDPPLRVGNEDVQSVDKMDTPKGLLRLLSPTDIIKDRLAAWAYWQDRQSLDQAVMVAKDQTVDLDALDAWAQAEGIPVVIKELKNLL